MKDALRIVDEYRRWLGSHEFPEVARVLDNLYAELNGEGLNAGTPREEDNCVISSLREQLRNRRRAAPTEPAGQAVGEPPRDGAEHLRSRLVQLLNKASFSHGGDRYSAVQCANGLAALAAPTPAEPAKTEAMKRLRWFLSDVIRNGTGFEQDTARSALRLLDAALSTPPTPEAGPATAPVSQTEHDAAIAQICEVFDEEEPAIQAAQQDTKESDHG